MMSSSRIRLHLVSVAVLCACAADTLTEVGDAATRPALTKFAGSEWSDPVNLGSVVNSAAADNNPTLSPDGLSLYFASDRPGGLGLTDIWVSRRASLDSPWETPVNLGAPVNTPFGDGAPALSIDGHLLFFHSNRPGRGGNDIWLARRSGSTNEDDWEAPVSLGPDVNTAGDDQGPDYVISDEGGALYFNRGAQASGMSDLYRAEVGRDGRTRGPAMPVAELNDPATNDAAPTLRTDGKEILFWSGRAGGFGGSDIWVSTRQSVNDSWARPENWGGPPFNSTGVDLQPDLSRDGRTLLFTSDRPGGSGGNDIWMSTRSPSGN